MAHCGTRTDWRYCPGTAWCREPSREPTVAADGQASRPSTPSSTTGTPPETTNRESAPSTSSTTSPSDQAGALHYTADWTGGLDGWIGSGEWLLSQGKLLNTGSA